MDPRRVASIAAVVGGLAWLAEVGLIWAAADGSTDSGLVWIAYVVGLAGLFVALAAVGYTLAEKAPVWLRAVVTVATPLLVVMVWVLLNQAILTTYRGDSWLREELGTLVAAAVALLLGLWGLRRRRSPGPATEPDPTPRPERGRRAAR